MQGPFYLTDKEINHLRYKLMVREDELICERRAIVDPSPRYLDKAAEELGIVRDLITKFAPK
jgi:hypothetical protein